jgi:hypothetical protein
MMIRRRVFDRIGGFSTALTCPEVLDWIASARDAGINAAQIDTVVLRRRIRGDNTVVALHDLPALTASLGRPHAGEAFAG